MTHTLEQDRSFHDAMSSACETGNFQMAQHLVQTRGDAWVDWDGCLRTAAGADQVELVEFMIQQGATMLDWALERTAQTGAIKAARLLIEKGAVDREGECFDNACWMGYTDLVELMMDKLQVDLISGVRMAIRNRHFVLAERISKKAGLDYSISYENISDGLVKLIL